MKYISVEEGQEFLAITIRARLNEAGRKLGWLNSGINYDPNDDPKCLRGSTEYALVKVRTGYYKNIYLIRPTATDGPISFWGSLKGTLKADMAACLNAAAQYIETNPELLEEIEALSAQYSMETL